MRRWSWNEVEELAEMRMKLRDKLTKRRPLPDVIGDRRLLRFLRGHNHNIDKACLMYSKFLDWRDQYNVDGIRDKILYSGMRSVYDFPNGKKIVGLIPQTIISANALDKYGNPVAVEHFGFDPQVVLKEITKDEYITFMIYMLEYKVLLLEQMAHELEQEYIAAHLHQGDDDSLQYGVILATHIIRDFRGVGLAHVGGDGQKVLKWILEIATDNYPELLHKCDMVNVPWLFNTIWHFIKGLMDPNTIKKVSIQGADFMPRVLENVPISSIPTSMGGDFKPKKTLHKFDLSETGPFYYPDCSSTIINIRRLSTSGLAALSADEVDSALVRKLSTARMAPSGLAPEDVGIDLGGLHKGEGTKRDDESDDGFGDDLRNGLSRRKITTPGRPPSSLLTKQPSLQTIAIRNTAQVVYTAGMKISPVLKIANPSAAKAAASRTTGTGGTGGLFRNGQINTPQVPVILDGKARMARKKRGHGRGGEDIRQREVSKMNKETYCMGVVTKDSSCTIM